MKDPEQNNDTTNPDDTSVDSKVESEGQPKTVSEALRSAELQRFLELQQQQFRSCCGDACFDPRE